MKREKSVSDNEGKFALVYCRVSTKSQEDGTSLDSQAAGCIKHAESLGYKVGKVTREVFSGAELWDRPQLARDREDLKSGKYRALICHSTDRLARDPIHLSIIAQECDRSGIELVFVTEPMDSTPEGMLIRYVKGYAAQIEREKIRERMMRGRKAKLISGKPVFVGDGLYGYRPDREGGQYIIYEPEAVIVRNIFQMCLRGFGASSIARHLNNQGIPSPKSAKSTWANGSHWCQGAIYNILKNSSYKGEEYQWKTKRVKEKGEYKEKRRPKSEWVRLPDGIRPPIVSPENWQAAQETFKSNKGATRRNELKPVLLRAHIFCTDCGRGLHLREYVKYNKGRDMYRCNSNNKLYDTECNGESVPYEEMNEWIWQEVKAILNDPSIIELEIKRLEKTDPNPQLKRDLESAKKQLAKVERGLQALLRRFRNSADDSNLWPYIEREIGQAGKEKEQLETTIADIQNRIAKQTSIVDDLRTLKDYCKQVRGRLDKFGFEDKRLAFKALRLKVYASGKDKSQWRYEISIPMEQLEPIKSAAGAAGAKSHFCLVNQDSFGSGTDGKARAGFCSPVSCSASHDF
jgi:site-specific DNA recombinase